MTTAFVLSGGGSLGAVQVGMLRALAERDVQPDLLIGTSAGAINAAYVAGHGVGRRSLDDLANVWKTLRRQTVFPLDPVRHALAVTGLRSSLCSSDNLRRLIVTHVTYRRLQDAPIPVHIVTTNLLSGNELLLSDGDAVSAVVASASIPGVFPPVQRDGLTLVDGGVSNNAALSQAVALGADEIYVLPTGFACARQRPPGTAIGVAVQALSLLIQQRLVTDIAHFADHARINVLPPLCPLDVSATDFRHASELIERARRSTRHWLGIGGPRFPEPERFLSLHDHSGEPDTGRHACDVTADQSGPAPVAV